MAMKNAEHMTVKFYQYTRIKYEQINIYFV